MLHMPSPMLVATTSAPFGQQLFTANGNTSFVVPAGVTTLCAVAIGHGGRSVVNDAGAGGDSGGGGGALSYSNSIAVTPGETLTVSISQSGEGGSGSRLLRAGTVLVRAQQAVYNLAGEAGGGTGDVRFSGGYGDVPGATPRNITGGGAGGYTSAGGQGATGGTSNGGGGTSPLGGGAGASAGGSGSVEGANYGGGAGVSSGGTAGGGGLGCVRIIWGAGRAFPNTNTGDMS